MESNHGRPAIGVVYARDGTRVEWLWESRRGSERARRTHILYRLLQKKYSEQ